MATTLSTGWSSAVEDPRAEKTSAGVGHDKSNVVHLKRAKVENELELPALRRGVYAEFHSRSFKFSAEV